MAPATEAREVNHQLFHPPTVYKEFQFGFCKYFTLVHSTRGGVQAEIRPTSTYAADLDRKRLILSVFLRQFCLICCSVCSHIESKGHGVVLYQNSHGRVARGGLRAIETVR
jgi:hypothetical protein